MIFQQMLEHIELRGIEQFSDDDFWIELTSEPEIKYLVNSVEPILRSRNLLDLIHRHMSFNNVYYKYFGIEDIPNDSDILYIMLPNILKDENSVLAIFEIFRENVQAVIDLFDEQDFDLGALSTEELFLKFIHYDPQL